MKWIDKLNQQKNEEWARKKAEKIEAAKEIVRQEMEAEQAKKEGWQRIEASRIERSAPLTEMEKCGIHGLVYFTGKGTGCTCNKEN